MAITVEDVAAGLRDALTTADPELLASMLHAQVRWGGEEDTPDTCHSSTDVLAWYRRAQQAGIRAVVTDTVCGESAVMLTLRLTGRDPSRPEIVHQVFRLRGGKVADIRGYPERRLALAVLGTPLPTPRT